MKVFTSECKDTATKYSMVLSECSYNMAMDWLQRDIKKSIYPREIYRIENNGTDDMQIYVGIRTYGRNPMTGYEDVWYTNTVIFHYDESRGYLMKE